MRPSDLGRIAQEQLPQYRLATPPKYPAWLVQLLLLLSWLPIIGQFILSPLNRNALVSAAACLFACVRVCLVFCRLTCPTPPQTWKDKLDTSKAKKELGITFRPLAVTVKDGVMSVIDGGYAKPKRRA